MQCIEWLPATQSLRRRYQVGMGKDRLCLKGNKNPVDKVPSDLKQSRWSSEFEDLNRLYSSTLVNIDQMEC